YRREQLSHAQRPPVRCMHPWPGSSLSAPFPRSERELFRGNSGSFGNFNGKHHAVPAFCSVRGNKPFMQFFVFLELADTEKPDTLVKPANGKAISFFVNDLCKERMVPAAKFICAILGILKLHDIIAGAAETQGVGDLHFR